MKSLASLMIACINAPFDTDGLVSICIASNVLALPCLSTNVIEYDALTIDGLALREESNIVDSVRDSPLSFNLVDADLAFCQ
jgi:hypothetical protein